MQTPCDLVIPILGHLLEKVYKYRRCFSALVVKNLPASAEDTRDAGSITRSGRCPEGGHGNPLKYSCLENPMDKGAWQATVHSISKSQT